MDKHAEEATSLLKEKEQIYKILVRKKKKEKTKPQQIEIPTNECQLVYKEENMVILRLLLCVLHLKIVCLLLYSSQRTVKHLKSLHINS
jgi:hypothetical protein